MQALKRQFLTVLDAAPLVEVDNINATPMLGLYEAVLDGIGCAFDLTVPANGLLTICAPLPVTTPMVTNATFSTATAPTLTAATFAAA